MRQYKNPESYLNYPKWVGTVALERRHRTCQRAGNAVAGPAATSSPKQSLGPDKESKASLRVEVTGMIIDRSLNHKSTGTDDYAVVDERMNTRSADRRDREVRLSQAIAPKVHAECFQLIEFLPPVDMERVKAGIVDSAKLLRIMAVPLEGSGTAADHWSPFKIVDIGQPEKLHWYWHKVMAQHKELGEHERADYAKKIAKTLDIPLVEATEMVQWVPLDELKVAEYLDQAPRLSAIGQDARVAVYVEVAKRFPGPPPSVS